MRALAGVFALSLVACAAAEAPADAAPVPTDPLETLRQRGPRETLRVNGRQVGIVPQQLGHTGIDRECHATP